MIGIGGEGHSLVFEVAMASKPLVQLTDEGTGVLEWTEQDARQLYVNARELWTDYAPAFDMAKATPLFWGVSPEEGWRELGQFLARAVIPMIDGEDEQTWSGLSAWLREVRLVGVFPSVALPYMLLKRPAEAASAAIEIADDIYADADDGRVGAAAKALRHWMHLAAISQAPQPPASLLTALIERVIFRRASGITSCLWHLSCLITE